MSCPFLPTRFADALPRPLGRLPPRQPLYRGFVHAVLAVSLAGYLLRGLTGYFYVSIDHGTFTSYNTSLSADKNACWRCHLAFAHQFWVSLV